MGLFTNFLSTASSPGDVIFPGNPNPARFTVEKVEQCGSNLVAQIRYAGVSNYEGTKILVWLDKTEEWLRSCTWVDPHFQENHDESPFARFEPTERGWYSAIGMLDGFY